MVLCPWATPSAKPAVPAALLTVAAAGVEELQVTAAVRSCVEPSP